MTILRNIQLPIAIAPIVVLEHNVFCCVGGMLLSDITIFFERSFVWVSSFITSGFLVVCDLGIFVSGAVPEVLVTVH